MPVYEYQCLSCGAHLERMQRFCDPLLTTCPQCGGELKKLLSLSSFQLKGSGWYVTDYKGKNPANGNGNGNGNGSHGEVKTDAATETKPKAKTETTADTKPAAPAEKPAETKSTAAK